MEVAPAVVRKVEPWRDRLSALDLERQCSASTSEDRCWLCDEIDDWNTVLRPLKLSLVEQQPGVLQLLTKQYTVEAALDSLESTYGAVSFTVWLPRKHRCVKEIHLGEYFPHLGDHAFPTSVSKLTWLELLTPSALPPPNLRGISLSKLQERTWVLLLDALGPVVHLEELAVSHVKTTNHFKLARLLSANVKSLRVISLVKMDFRREGGDVVMCGLLKCEKIEELTFDAKLSSNGVQHFTKLLRSTESFRKLCLSEVTSYSSDPRPGKCRLPHNDQILAAVGDLLRRSTTLTELRYDGNHHPVTAILSALETNKVLKILTIRVDGPYQHVFNILRGTELKSMLAKNQGLRLLKFEGCRLEDYVALPLSEGLQYNIALEYLDLSSCFLMFPAAEALCVALGVNQTLRSLNLGHFNVAPGERERLVEVLIRDKSFGRVQMWWGRWDAAILSTALLNKSLCPTELRLCDVLHSNDSFSVLCQHVSSSLHLKSLEVSFTEAITSKFQVASLRNALAQNRSLRRVFVKSNASGTVAVRAAEGLTSNKCVAELSIHCPVLIKTSAQLLASLFVANESLRKVDLNIETKPTRRRRDVLCQGLLQNKFVTLFSLYSRFDQTPRSCEVGIASADAICQRNIRLLNQAAHFVMKKNTGKRFAEAFEVLASKPQLIDFLMHDSGMGEEEAGAAVKAAERYVKSSFLIISGVVRAKVECHPGEGTQIDGLNADCWFHIASYLKVSDIPDENR